MQPKNKRQIKRFWQRVKAQLKALKVSQREFAEHIHISRRTLEGWIYQLRLPSLEAGSGRSNPPEFFLRCEYVLQIPAGLLLEPLIGFLPSARIV